MLDIKFIRDNPEKVKAGIANKNEKGNVDGVLALDEERRNIIVQVEELKATRNKVSSQIPKMKKAGEDTTEVLAEMKQVSDNVAEMDVLGNGYLVDFACLLEKRGEVELLHVDDAAARECHELPDHLGCLKRESFDYV